MHVLRQIHKALRPGGVLLDIHPQPKDVRIEVVSANRSTPIGTLDGSEDHHSIRKARKRLLAVQREGPFRLEGRRTFDLRIYHESVEAWLEFHRDQGYGCISELPPEVLRRTRRALRSEGGEIVLIEPVRASALIRIAVESNPS